MLTGNQAAGAGVHHPWAPGHRNAGESRRTYGLFEDMVYTTQQMGLEA